MALALIQLLLLIQLPSARHALALREWCADAADASKRHLYRPEGRVRVRKRLDAPDAKPVKKYPHAILRIPATSRRAEEHHPTGC